MKYIIDTIKEARYRKLLKRSFEPREEFLKSSREAFLAEVAKRRVAPLAPQVAWRAAGMHAFRYAVAFAAIALVGTSGLVAYADTTNVGVVSPLYPLKRVGEQVRLAVVPVQKEPEMRKEIAQRRARELFEIETQKRPDDDGGVEQLRKLSDTENELRVEFRKNIEVIEEHAAKRVDEPSVTAVGADLCQAAQAVERHSGNGKSERYKKFEDRCKELLKTDDDSGERATSTSSGKNGDRDGDKRSGSDPRDVDNDDKQGDGRDEDRSGKRVDRE